MLGRSLLFLALMVPTSSFAETSGTAFFQNAFCSGFFGGISSLSIGSNTFLGDASIPTTSEFIAASKDAMALITQAKDTGEIDASQFRSLTAIKIAGIDNATQIKRSIRSEDEFYHDIAQLHLKSTSELCDSILSNPELAISPKINWRQE